ncbi:MAG: hypothetical protein GY909_11810 [Oligoflexia bacterium]|nr:hypothetical protein [Oligoflexia bacterium]
MIHILFLIVSIVLLSIRDVKLEKTLLLILSSMVAVNMTAALNELSILVFLIPLPYIYFGRAKKSESSKTSIFWRRVFTILIFVTATLFIEIDTKLEIFKFSSNQYLVEFFVIPPVLLSVMLYMAYVSRESR